MSAHGLWTGNKGCAHSSLGNTALEIARNWHLGRPRLHIGVHHCLASQDSIWRETQFSGGRVDLSQGSQSLTSGHKMVMMTREHLLGARPTTLSLIPPALCAGGVLALCVTGERTMQRRSAVRCGAAGAWLVLTHETEALPHGKCHVHTGVGVHTQLTCHLLLPTIF